MRNKRPTDALFALDFLGSKIGNFLFYMSTSTDKLFSLVYPDAILLICYWVITLLELNYSCQDHFVVRDLVTLSYFLGIASTWTTEGLFLSQRNYVEDLLNQVHMVACSLVCSPINLRRSYPLLLVFLSMTQLYMKAPLVRFCMSLSLGRMFLL